MFCSGAKLGCGIHVCPQYCHQLYNHSKMLCERINESTCSEGHRYQLKCHTGQPKTCRTCEREAQQKQKELEAEFDRQSKREQKQAEHTAAMLELDRQIRLAREEAMDNRAAEERAQALEQRKRDLEAAMRLAKEAKNGPLSTKNEALPEQSLPSKSQSPIIAPSHSNRNERSTPGVNVNGVQSQKSKSEREWDRQKRVDGVSNDAIDGIMSLIQQPYSSPFCSVVVNLEISCRCFNVVGGKGAIVFFSPPRLLGNMILLRIGFFGGKGLHHQNVVIRVIVRIKGKR
jgi:hypothetical protein